MEKGQGRESCLCLLYFYVYQRTQLVIVNDVDLEFHSLFDLRWRRAAIAYLRNPSHFILLWI
jgi:hypothetical protein